MRFLIICAFLITVVSCGGGGGGGRNVCESDTATGYQFAVTGSDCEFTTNAAFIGCFDGTTELSVSGLTTSGDVLNCTIDGSSECHFDIVSGSSGTTFDCYAAFDSQGALETYFASGHTGEYYFYCDPPSENEFLLDGCFVWFQ